MTEARDRDGGLKMEDQDEIKSLTSRNTIKIIFEICSLYPPRMCCSQRIEPINILVKWKENNAEIKICDFGSATFINFKKSKVDNHDSENNDDNDDSAEEKEGEMLMKGRKVVYAIA